MRRTKKTEKGLVQEGGLARRSVHAKAGRIVIPRRLRKVFEIRDGTPVVLEVKPEGILLSRNDSVGVGDRDRPGRFHRRLADELGCILTKLNGYDLSKPGWSAGRRPVRARSRIRGTLPIFN